MSEVTLQWIQILKLLCLVGVAGLYGFGGVSGKWKRRIIAPIVLTIAILGLSLWTDTFSWLYAFFFLPIYGIFSVGYGVNSKIMKFTKSKILTRLIAGLGVGISAVFIAIPNQAWLLLLFHIGLCVSANIILGVYNPTKSARAEETMLGFVAGFLPMLGMI